MRNILSSSLVCQIVCAVCCLAVSSKISAASYTLSGYVSDQRTGETLINAVVYDKLSGKGTVSNLYGFYSLTLEEGPVEIVFSYLGYLPLTYSTQLTSDEHYLARLNANVHLEEVVVLGRENQEIGVHGTQMSAIEIPVSQIKTLPTLFGESDVLKALQLLPGVKGGVEGTTGMYVRGGGPDENLMLLDGVPVYNVNHAGGFFSVFNADAIKNVTLYKGNFPARFGGRLSSVVDVRMKDGDDKEIHGNVSLGLISSKFNLEGPIIKEKTTFNVSLRRTYSDLLLNPAMQLFNSYVDAGYDRFSAGYYFYDLNLKLAHKFSDRDRLYLSFYSGDDAIYAKVRLSEYTDDVNHDYSSSRFMLDWKWGNLVSALRWNHVLNQKLFMNTTASYTQYRFKMGIGEKIQERHQEDHESFYAGVSFRSSIEDYTLKTDIDYAPNPNHDIKLGANYTFHTFRPGVSVLSVESVDNNLSTRVDTSYGDADLFSHEWMLYAEDNVVLGDYVKLNAGLHYSAYLVNGQFYHSLQPRLGTRVLLGESVSFKAGYALMSQYIHLLSNTSISLPTDLWVPVTKRVLPMKSHQVSGGFFYNWRDKVDFSVEAYYKSMNNLIEYRDGATFFGSSTGWEDKVCMGRGWSYGVEFLAQKSFGKTTGWLGYTWSKSERLFNRPGQELNQGRVFPAKYDRRHDISLTASHKFSDRFDVAATWVYSTGNCCTLSLQEYSLVGSGYLETVNYYESRNNYRFNDYHRLDIGLNFHKQKKRGVRTWSLSVYNAYNQMNPFLLYPTTISNWNPDTNTLTIEQRLAQITVFTILPSISYSFTF